MSVVRIPPVLRPVVDGARELPASGGTVGAVLDDLFTSQPALAAQLRPDGSLSSFVNVYVNGDDIRHREGFDTPVGTTDVVILLPAMAGGAHDDRHPGRLMPLTTDVPPWAASSAHGYYESVDSDHTHT